MEFLDSSGFYEVWFSGGLRISSVKPSKVFLIEKDENDLLEVLAAKFLSSRDEKFGDSRRGKIENSGSQGWNRN